MGGGGASCGACKFLRRRCVKGCVFAPYFRSDEMGAPEFGAIHKVFGASNFSKLLLQLPVEQRYDAVASVSYEAQARLQDPVYGCVSHILALQHQVANLKGKLDVGYAQLAACSSSDEASLTPEYGDAGKQSEMPSLISNSSSSCPNDQQYLNPWGNLRSIPSENIAVNNYDEEAREDEGSWGSFYVCGQGAIHPPSTAQEKDVFRDAEGLSQQRHTNNYRDGDLQDLASALLRRNR